MDKVLHRFALKCYRVPRLRGQRWRVRPERHRALSAQRTRRAARPGAPTVGSARPPAGPHDTKTQDATHSSTPPAAGARAEEGTTKGSPQTGKTKESQFAAAEERHCTGTRALAPSRVANQPAAGRGARRAPRWKEMKCGQGLKTICCCCCCCGAGGGVGLGGVGGAMCPAQAPTQPAPGAARGARQGARTQACRPGPAGHLAGQPLQYT